MGKKELHFHDLRHTGNMLAARTKASTKDLMAKMGHDSERAALIYQHATTEADREIALGLSGLINELRLENAKQEAEHRNRNDSAAGVLAPIG